MRALRWLGYGLGALVGLAGVGVGYLYLVLPVMPVPSQDKVVADEALLARGTYLAEHVAVCIDCHSERDWSKFAAPVIPGTIGKGGEKWGHEIGMPGELYAPNITPTHVGSWSDGEVARALVSGVTPEGRALFPLMNYMAYSKLCRQDVDALVAYVRTLKPIENEVPESKLDFPLNLIVRTMPAAAQLGNDCADGKDTVARGAYLVNAGNCQDCHTPRKGPELDVTRAFAGGNPFPTTTGATAVSKNLTPDASGIGSWTREAFIKRFAFYRDPANLHTVGKGDLQTPMPWTNYAGMTDDDLGAIYDFLRTVKPVSNAAAVAAK